MCLVVCTATVYKRLAALGVLASCTQPARLVQIIVCVKHRSSHVVDYGLHVGFWLHLLAMLFDDVHYSVLRFISKF